MGLNDSYGNIIGQILLIEHFPSLSKVCSLILQEEKRSIGHGFNMIQSIDVVAMYVNNNKGFHVNQGHNHGGKRGNSKKERPLYTYRGLTHHIANKCNKLHSYPLVYKPKEGNKAMANQVSAILPSGNFGLDGFPSPLNVCLHIAGALPTSVLPNVSAQSDIVPTSQNFFGHSVGGSHLQASPQTSLSQCPLSQAQCE